MSPVKTIFDPQVLSETLHRIEGLSASAPPLWGKMSPTQMMEHTSRVLEMALGRRAQKQILIGRLIAWVFKSRFIGEQPFQKNAPTGPDFVIREDPNFAATKLRLVGLLSELHAAGATGTDGHVHAFFGELTGEEWGITQYKHLDHHLRQFGA